MPRGRALAHGTLFAFIDADVFLTESWVDEFLRIEPGLATLPMTVTGAAAASGGTELIERHWFAPVVQCEGSYINSGNLVTTRLHEAINGFSETLVTGEDVDYCQRHAAGATIAGNVKLRTVHEGYPKTLRGFVRREMWHGRGDVANLGACCGPASALCAVFFSAMHVVLACGAIARSLPWIAVGLLGIAALCMADCRCGDRTASVSRTIQNFDGLRIVQDRMLLARVKRTGVKRNQQ